MGRKVDAHFISKRLNEMSLEERIQFFNQISEDDLHDILSQPGAFGAVIRRHFIKTLKEMKPDALEEILSDVLKPDH